MAGNILLGGGIGAIIDHTKGTAYTYPTWVQLVFGQTQVFDRKNEKDGQVVLGQKSAGTLARAVPTVASAALGPQPAYLATGYARIDDVDAVPLLGDRGREKYREFLTKPTPRTFAIGPEGQFSWANGLKPLDATMPSNPSARVLLTCERIAKVPCTLYAVNGAVVCWGDNYGGEIGTGHTTDIPIYAPTPVAGIAPAQGVTVGTWNSCVKRAGGELVCWGTGNDGALGNGDPAATYASKPGKPVLLPAPLLK